MPKLGPIQIDNRILDALRDDRLVIFAGAGVSIGPPSNLPGFDKLARDVATGTGHELIGNEPIDRFLGRLKHQQVDVHGRAAQQLNPVGSAPNALHSDLLRLFRSAERVRLITTNFDQHFEMAAEVAFSKSIDVYRAPALPLGSDFYGVVHVHGALTHPQKIVLTDVDFGRAYLTEGWARRFLVDVFRTYTVLFVGYGHNDIVMNYLARALPAEGVKDRFALTEEDGAWELLGITPLRFQKSEGSEPYRELYDGVRLLADWSTRGVMDWQSRIAEICSGVPPADEEVIGEVEQALREVHTTRFFVQVARAPGWPSWLSARKQLDELFDGSPLNEKGQLVASWLAEHYAIDYSDECFELIAAHRLRLNPYLWHAFVREIGLDDKKDLQQSVLTRWVAILIACVQDHMDRHALMWLAERSVKLGAIVSALEVFLLMGWHKFGIKPGFVWPSDERDRSHQLEVQTPLRADHWGLNKVWTTYLKSNIESIVQPLLSGIVRRFEDIHHGLVAWGKADRNGDAPGWGRAAIEPNDQDKYPEAIDVLIDAGRDALEWLAENRLNLLNAWIETLVASDVPLLRRLAIHGMAIHPEQSSDNKLAWLLNRVGLHQRAEHHETYRLAAIAYPVASNDKRQAVIDAILQYQWPDVSSEHAKHRTMREQFNWLDWLQSTDPSCALLQAALLPIRKAYPDWAAREHPDLTHWTSAGWVGPKSPWTVEQLLSKKPSEQLDDLLQFQGNHFDGPDRAGLIQAVSEVCKQQFGWSLQLDEALTERELWRSDLWSSVLRGWRDTDLSHENWVTVLQRIARPEIYAQHPSDVADLLYLLVRDGGKAFALELLNQANGIARDIWQALPPENTNDEIDDWLSRAINRPAGVLVEFWINGLSLLMHGKSGNERLLPEEYRNWLTTVVQDQTLAGGLGRSILASQTAFLFGLDERWTRQNIIPLFSDPDRDKFAQAWDGFLVWGRLFPELVDELQPAFMSALPRFGVDLPERRRQFIEFFAALTAFHVNDPTQQLLPMFFHHGNGEDHAAFAAHLGYYLRQMSTDNAHQLWERWLHRYWQNRLQSVPAPLSDTESRAMLEWLLNLGDAFPAAVQLAVQGASVTFDHSNLLYELKDSDLISRYPKETAQLLVFICAGNVPSYFCADLLATARNLTAELLGADLHRSLSDAMARAGCIDGTILR